MFRRNKPRLYIICYFRPVSIGGNPDPYHWGLVYGPKNGSMVGMYMYHVQNFPDSQGVIWRLESPPRDLSRGPTPAMLTFTSVAKITNLRRLQTVISSVPVNATATWETFNCQVWVRNALEAIVADGRCLGTNALAQGSWPALHRQCLAFSEPYRQAKMHGRTLPDPRPIQSLL